MSWVSLLLLVGVVGGGYLAWVWAPVYFDHYTVKQVVADYMNQAVKNRDDAALRHAMVARIHALGTVDVVGPDGRAAKAPAIPVEEQAVTWERDPEAKLLHIAFEYEREVVYPVLERTVVKTFVLDRTGDLTLPDWGPAR